MVDVWTEVMAKCGLDKVDDFEDVAKITSSCYMVPIALDIIPTCSCKLTFVV